MREVVIDTETTGLDPAQGHRVVEVGCLELVNGVPSGRSFQAYVNPERDVPAEAHAVHGLSAEFLADHPTFAGIAGGLLDFLGDAPLVAHNAEFDLGFLNAELALVGLAPLAPERAVDTVGLARRRFPGAPASLDALCRRFGIDLGGRALHGALKDAELLARVYLELIGGRQPDLALATIAGAKAVAGPRTDAPARPPRPHAPTPEEEAAHARFIDRLTRPVWRA